MTEKYKKSHRILIDKLHETKEYLIKAIQSGDRDFESQKILFAEYIDLQTAADFLLSEG